MKKMLVLWILCFAGTGFAEEAKPAAKPAKDRPMLSEWLKDPERIKKYDKNGDGKLSPEERYGAREDYRKEVGIVLKPGTQPPPAIEKPPKRDFERQTEAENLKKYDKNGDGKLDAQEIQAARDGFMPK